MYIQLAVGARTKVTLVSEKKARIHPVHERRQEPGNVLQGTEKCKPRPQQKVRFIAVPAQPKQLPNFVKEMRCRMKKMTMVLVRRTLVIVK